MLSRAIGGLRRVGRTKRTVMSAGTLLLMLGLMTVAVVLAADPVVNGTITSGDEWGSPVRTDPDEDDAIIPDKYDIEDVYMRASDNNATFYGAFEVYGPPIQLNTPGGSVAFYFDTDVNSGTGEANTFCPNIGAEYMLNYSWPYVWDAATLKYNGGWTLAGEALAAHNSAWEAATAHYLLGLTTTKCISVALHFENFDAQYGDDSVCDLTYCFTDGVTAVDLSSFTADSGGADSPAMQPGMLALLGLGVALFAAGGLVLWRGRSLAG